MNVSMLMPPFELHEPTSIKDACELKARLPGSDFVSGGTDLLPNYKWGLNVRKHVISLGRVQGMRDITLERIGALATLTNLDQSSALAERLPVLPQTARQIATLLLRNSGTLGGNLMLENRCFFFNQTYFWRESKNFCLKADGDACLVVPQKQTCYATFSADMPAPLIALRASIELASASGTRHVPLSGFYRGDGIERNVKRPEELVTAVTIPREAQSFRATYKKLRLRDSFDFPELGIAAAVRFDGDVVAEARLVANALETTPVVLDDVASTLVGHPLDDARIAAVAKDAEERVRPVKNTNLPPSYRKAMTRVFTQRAFRDLAASV